MQHKALLVIVTTDLAHVLWCVLGDYDNILEDHVADSCRHSFVFDYV